MADHHHHHRHSHPEDERILQEQLDTAGKSLARALQVSFVILKAIIVVLLGIFLFSGVFQVQQDEEALQLRFGKIKTHGPESDPVLKPGIKFGWPEPIDEIIRIPVQREQTLAINAFWYYESERDKLAAVKPPKTGPLDPVLDGYNLTRNDVLEGMEGIDYNIVHSMWTVTYKIEDPKKFFENVYIRNRQPGEDLIEAAAYTLEPLLKSLVCNAITLTMVHYTIDEAIKNELGIASGVKISLQKKLDQMDAGIQIKDVRANPIVWPRQVDKEFQDSTVASQEKKKALDEANAYKTTMLTNTGGPLAEDILEKLKQPDLPQKQQEAEVEKLSGQVQSEISDARAYSTKVVEDAKANAEYLHKLLPEYRKNPKLVLQKIYQDAIEQVLINVDEKIFIQPTPEGVDRELRFLLNRDPNIKKTKPKNQMK